MQKAVSIAALIMLFSAIVFAHGNEQHVMGTVTAIDNGSITVRTTAGSSVTIQLDPKTRFTKGGSAAAIAELKVGDRVVIHAMKDHDKLIARTVKFGSTSTVPKGAHHQHLVR
jgi:ribosomal protein S1